jgi:hypothetical protein
MLKQICHMKILFKILLAAVISTTLCMSCNDNENEDDEIIVTYPVDIEVSDYSLDETPCRWNNQTTKADTLYVINSKNELLTCISCQEALVPHIDFDKNTLLLVRGGTPQWVISTTRQFQQTSINEYKLVIDITMSMITLPGFWHIAILTPKLQSNVIIEAEITKHH